MNDLYRGIIIVYPHGDFIVDGSKKIIVKSRAFYNAVDKPLLLIQDKYALGIIYLRDIKEIGLDEFNKKRNLHRITEEERNKWWPDKKILYEYRIDVNEIFMAAIPVDYKPGPQVFVKIENIIFRQKIYIGTCGYDYKWDEFYNNSIDSGLNKLEVYSGGLNSVEINSSFYKNYSSDFWKNLLEGVGKDFRFSVKVNRGITHFYQFDNFDFFWNNVKVLGRKLKCLLFQFPKRFVFNEKNMGRLAGLNIPVRCAFEFRDSSWFNDDVFNLFSEKKNWSVVISYVNEYMDWNLDLGFNPKFKNWVRTSDFVYFRMHGTTGVYTGSHKRILSGLVKFIRSLDVKYVFVYFNNTDSLDRAGYPDALNDAAYLEDKLVLL